MKLLLAMIGGILLWPSHVIGSSAVLAEPVKFPVVVNGRRIGESTVQAGTKVKVLGQAGSRVRVQYGSAEPVWVEAAAVRDLQIVAEPEKAEAAAEPPAPAEDEPTPPDDPSEEPNEDPADDAEETPAAAEESEKPTKEKAEEKSADTFASPVRFEIDLNGEKVPIERYGTGETGIIIFSNSGDLAADIRAAMEHYEPLSEKGCSLFLWSYPKSGPFAEVQNSIGSFMGGGEERLEFTGVATAVLEGIKKETGLEKFLLAGNSLGGGVILWDHAELAKDKNIKFLLVAPTEVFMPDIEKIGPMDNTALIAHKRGDDFIRDRKILSWIAANQSPLTKEAESRAGHIIVGNDLGHEQFAAAITSFLGLPAR